MPFLSFETLNLNRSFINVSPKQLNKISSNATLMLTQMPESETKPKAVFESRRNNKKELGQKMISLTKLSLDV